MQVYFMRHGQTNYNRQNLCNDDPAKDVHLTELGKQQAQTVANKLKEHSIDKVIVSELPRTRQTAEIVNRHHHAPIEIHAAINDIRSGFDSRPVHEYQRAIAHDPLHARCNGGESLLAHKQRVLGFIHWLAKQPEQHVLVIAHEETLRVFRAYFENLSDEVMIGLSFDNCAYYQYPLDE